MTYYQQQCQVSVFRSLLKENDAKENKLREELVFNFSEDFKILCCLKNENFFYKNKLVYL
jgi:hypothetical protein